MICRLSAIVLAAGLMLWPAHAFPCDADGGGDSGGDSGSDSDYDGDDSSYSGPSCVETTEIHGRAECRSFGGWDASRYPRLRLGVGSSVSVFPMAGLSFQGEAEHDGKMAYRLDTESGDSDAVATALDLRMTMMAGRYGYVGSNLSLGAVLLPNLQTKAATGLDVDTKSGMYAAVTALAGAGFTMGPLTIRGEAHVGRRFIVVGVETSHEECVESSAVQAGQWMVRPQVAMEAWVTPWMTAGASLSTDVLRDRDVSGGVFIELHSRAFDGLRSRR